MSCGREAFKRANINVNNYFASEVDKYAIMVAKKNHPSNINVGDVRFLDSKDFTGVDIIIGGSPCQNFSFAGKRKGMSTSTNEEILTLSRYMKLKREGFSFKGESFLFWEFVRLVKRIKPKYFLLENVIMSKKWENVITEALGVEPIMINSSLVSAQNRKRLYWTNIPNVKQPEDKGILLSSVLAYSRSTRYPKGKPSHVESRVRYNGKTNTLTTGDGCGSFSSFNFNMTKLNHTENALDYMNRKMKNGKSRWGFGYIQEKSKDKAKCLTANICKGVLYNVLVDKKPEQEMILEIKNDTLFRKLHTVECERLQTLSDNYTFGVSDTQRYKMIGNGWTIDVISHIFKSLKTAIQVKG